MAHYLTDSFGRSYDEGRTYETRDAALSAARQISEDDRPYGVWIASDDENDVGEEIIPATKN